MSVPIALCQQKNSDDAQALIDEYKSWLQLTHLDRLLEAKSFVSPKGALPNSKTLVLEPSKNYQDPERFAKAWNKLQEKLLTEKRDIYTLLFNKLAAYSNLASNQLSITITSADTEVFSLRIYCTDDVHHKGTILSERGDNDSPDLGLDLSFLLDDCFNTPKGLSALQICKVLHDHFIKYRHDAGGIQTDSIINAHQTGLKYRISNINGVVTNNNLHEVIILNITADANGICYNVDISYAGGARAPDPDKKPEFYHDAIFRYRSEYDNYAGRTLKLELRKIFNGK